MSEVSSSQNLNAHYSKEAKVKRPYRPIASPPGSLPKPHLFNDIDANNRLKVINQDIYQEFKKEEKKKGLKFINIFGAGILALLALLGIKRVFK